MLPVLPVAHDQSKTLEGGVTMADSMPPISGIARRKRSDAGVSRTTSVDGICDKFLDLPVDQQRIVLEVLRALHRQVVARITPKRQGTAEEQPETMESPSV